MGYENSGMEELKEKRCRNPMIKNRVSEEVKQGLVAFVLEELAFLQKRAADTLHQHGVFISPVGVCCVWLRYGVEKFAKRLQQLEKHKVFLRNLPKDNTSYRGVTPR